MKSFLQKSGISTIVFLFVNKVLGKTLILLELDVGQVFIASLNRSRFLKG